MLSEPCHVARPFSCTAVRQVPPSTVSAAYRESAREPLRARKSEAEDRSILGSVSLAFQAARLVVILVLVARLRAGGATRFEVDEAASEDQEEKS